MITRERWSGWRQAALFVGSLCRHLLLFYSLLLRLERVEKTGLGRAFLDLSIYLSDYIYSLWFYFEYYGGTCSAPASMISILKVGSAARWHRAVATPGKG